MILTDLHYVHFSLGYNGLAECEYKSNHKQNPSTSCEEEPLKHAAYEPIYNGGVLIALFSSNPINNHNVNPTILVNNTLLLLFNLYK